MIIPDSWKTNKFESEDQFQVKAYLILSQEFPELRGKIFHSKNENYIPKNPGESEQDYKKRAMITAGRFKAKGLLPGVPDLLCVHNGILYKLELKMYQTKTNEAQDNLHLVWNLDCPQIPVVVARTMEEVYKWGESIIRNNYKINFL